MLKKRCFHLRLRASAPSHVSVKTYVSQEGVSLYSFAISINLSSRDVRKNTFNMSMIWTVRLSHATTKKKKAYFYRSLINVLLRSGKWWLVFSEVMGCSHGDPLQILDPADPETDSTGCYYHQPSAALVQTVWPLHQVFNLWWRKHLQLFPTHHGAVCHFISPRWKSTSSQTL